MKAIKILDTDEKSEFIMLTTAFFVGYTIDKGNYVLRIHRWRDGRSFFDNIQLKAWGFFESDTPNPLMPTQHGLFANAYSIVEEKMEEFLADDDESILDISAYVDQEVISRDDDEEDNPSIFDAFMEQLKKDRALTTEDEEWVCSNCGKAANRCRTKRYSPRGRPIEDEEEKRCDYYDDGKCELASEAPKRWCQYYDDGKCQRSDKGNSSCEQMTCDLKR